MEDSLKDEMPHYKLKSEPTIAWQWNPDKFGAKVPQVICDIVVRRRASSWGHGNSSFTVSTYERILTVPVGKNEVLTLGPTDVLLITGLPAQERFEVMRHNVFLKKFEHVSNGTLDSFNEKDDSSAHDLSVLRGGVRMPSRGDYHVNT